MVTMLLLHYAFSTSEKNVRLNFVLEDRTEWKLSTHKPETKTSKYLVYSSLMFNYITIEKTNIKQAMKRQKCRECIFKKLWFDHAINGTFMPICMILSGG